MEETAYGLKVTVNQPYDAAVEHATEALKAQGFGVLTVIDVSGTLKRKLGVDSRRYVILGACNPTLAHRAPPDARARLQDISDVPVGALPDRSPSAMRVSSRSDGDGVAKA